MTKERDSMLKKLGCHLYPWNHVLSDKGIFSDEMDAVLSWIKEQGFSGIETGTRFIPVGKEEEVKNLLEAKGLQIAGIHMGAAIFEINGALPMDDIVSEIKRVKATGTGHIVLSGMKKIDISREEASYAAKMLNQIGEVCKAEGIRLVYHNHDYEFVNDQTVQTTLIKETNPEYVSFALDLGWAYYAGTDLNEFYGKYSERMAYFHYRDVIGGKFIELGRGEMDFTSFIELIENHGFSGWNIVEMELGESYAGESEVVEDLVAASIRYLKEMK
jgi:sugar phosphate isomerase/epimerase